jgi:hypothetical protein
MNWIESKVDDTLSDSRGSFRKTSVRPFCFEKTSITKPDNLISDSVIWSGIVRPDAAARGCGDANAGLVERYVLSGLAWTRVFSVKKASPE